ncbi:MAG: hypothetical protein AABY22_21575 [Nanoarchaeota archaeon]|mgnify:CR=1 FL=1
MNNFENQQKRITFQNIHGKLIDRLKPIQDFTVKDHEGVVEYAYQLVEDLFKRYPYINGKSELKTELKTDEAPY